MLTYTQKGDYLLPNLKLPEQKTVHIGVWGKRHAEYLKANHRVLYYNLLTSCKLSSYLSDIDAQAQELFDSIVQSLAEQENVTEELKATNQMLWVQKMNNISNRAMEVVCTDIIFQ